MPDAVVIGAGIVGAACAHFLARAGLSVTVVDRGGVAGGTTGAGEGNILVSDKEPGPELDLALLSVELWRTLGLEEVELEPKGGLVVAATEAEMVALSAFAATQRGVTAQPVASLSELEPCLAPGLAGGMYYPQDMQVQPMLAAAALLRGVDVRLRTTVVKLEPGAVHTDDGLVLRCDAVINAAGVWAGQLPGVRVPVLPRRGFVLVTGRVGELVRHKVYAATYVSNVGSSDADLQTSAVVEGTRAGNVLIGSSRERVGFDGTFSLRVLRRLAQGAVALFPALADVQVIRAYRGFRPYTPDHLPIIGPDPFVPGLYHATGHEGAGVGLAPATGRLIADMVTGRAPVLDPSPFSAGRFAR
ncbi:NAD(P)/FAD-dependent oxidoreductase [Allorhizocola rhizosphaerae]|uniref:NAD(P)/FAD-dependent oxidoreductase n=1 Tax=Allorhizocola rhizosphaerae TaxID=1872709 RepID=UPI001FEBB9B8|nr:FAD-dependent oxidoreductase [Allorhizocola rhizosphaerae]